MSYNSHSFEFTGLIVRRVYRERRTARGIVRGGLRLQHKVYWGDRVLRSQSLAPLHMLCTLPRGVQNTVSIEFEKSEKGA